MSSQIYIRVKRKKTTVFLDTTPSEQIVSLKRRLEPIVKVAPENIRLVLNDKPLEDNKSVGDSKIDNDELVALCFRKDDGDWEEVDLTPVSAHTTDAGGES